MLINASELQKQDLVFTMYFNRKGMERYVEENKTEYDRWLKRRQIRNAFDCK